MSEGEYTVGEVYYQLGLASVVQGGDPRLVVSSWRYDGVKKLTCNSRECDVPYHFLCFRRVTGEDDALGATAPNQLLYIASNTQARLSMLEWHEFLSHLNDLGKDQRGWAKQ